MKPEQLKAIKHYTNKLQILVFKHENTKNINIQNDIAADIKNIIENFKL